MVEPVYNIKRKTHYKPENTIKLDEYPNNFKSTKSFV